MTMTFRLGLLHLFFRRVSVSLAAAAMVLFLGSLVGNARAATLEISGPAGMEVLLDGRPLGFLPLSEPVNIPAGEHELSGTLTGYAIYKQRLVFPGQNDYLVLSIRLTPLSRRTALGSNLLLAGLGQHYTGHSTRGWLYSTVEISGLLTALAGEIQRSSFRKDYLLLQDRYNQTINADDLATLRLETTKAYTDMEDMESLRNTGLAIAGGVILLSMIDTWFSFPHITTGSGTLPVVTMNNSLANPQPAFHAGLCLGF